MNSPTKTYDPVIDILRIVCILAVIMIHSTTKTLESVHLNITLASGALFLNQISRFAVPLFFMISGFVLEMNNKHLSYFNYLKRRINRLLIPYIFWSAIYYLFVYRTHTVGFVDALIYGSSSYQLYFIPSLLVFYFIFPLLRRIPLNTISLIILFIVQMIFLYHDYYIHSLPIFYPLGIALLNFFIFLCGIYAYRHKQRLLVFIYHYKLMLSLITLLLSYFIFTEGRDGYLATGNYLKFYSQWRPSVLIYTLSLASILYIFFHQFRFPNELIKKLSSLSFFVFFIHVWILELVLKLFPPHPLILFSFTTLISFALAFLVHRFSALSKLTG